MPIAIDKSEYLSSRGGEGSEHEMRALLGPEYAVSELKTIIADVLRIDPDELDETQSFLKLGGDSILAIKIMARSRAKGMTLNVADMIDAENILDLYQRVLQSLPGASIDRIDAHMTNKRGSSALAFKDSIKAAKLPNPTKYESGKDFTDDAVSHRIFNKQTTSVVKSMVLESADANLLLRELPSSKTQHKPLDIIHAASVTAALITTSCDIEDILFYDVCRGDQEDPKHERQQPYTISRSRIRISPSKDNARLLRRLRDCTHGDMDFGEGDFSQPDPHVLTPASESDEHIIIIDVRQLTELREEKKRPVEPVSTDFTSDAEAIIHSLPELTISFCPTDNGVSCSFSGSRQKQAHCDLDGFISVFFASIKGILRRSENSEDMRTSFKNKVAPQGIEVSKTSEDFQDSNLRYGRLDALSVDSLKRILRPETRKISAVLPCLLTQENFLVSQTTSPNLYQCCFVLKLQNRSLGIPVDARQVGAAWKEVVRRHSTLRTIFVPSSTRPGCFDQIAVENFDPCIEYIEPSLSEPLTALSPVEFNEFEVPHRLHLAQISPEEVHMKLEISHALIDGQSAEVLLKDLCTAYLGVPLANHSLDYGEFVSYQGQIATEPSRAYWSEYLSHAQPSFLPMDRGHEALVDLDMVSTDIAFGRNQLQSFCDAYGVTLSNVCQLAWGFVLRCLTGSDSVSFSYITSGRSAPLEGIHDAVGPFITTLPCCFSLGSSSSIKDLLKSIAKHSLEGFSHHYSADLHDRSKTSLRHLGNTTMSFQRALDTRAFSESALDFSIMERSNPTDYDIALAIGSKRNGLEIELDFWRSRLDRQHASDILELLCEAIHAILRNPQGLVSDMSLLRDKDKSQLEQWNHGIPKARNICLHQPIWEMAYQQSDAPAINAWDGDLTYKELYVQAATLASYLVTDLHVKPETMVAVCMNKSKYAIVAMLAILQAGGVVVPLGVSHPLTRHKVILKDTAATLVMVDSEQEDRLAGLVTPNLHLLRVDQTLLASLPVQEEAPLSQVTANNAAWIIFTSGSTGVPKGVLMSHGALSTSVQAHGAVFGTSPRTRAAQFAAYTFDVSISDIFSTLHHGGCVCVFSEENRMDDLTEALQRYNVNYMNLTPTVVRLLDPLDLPLVEVLVVGGEPLDTEIVRKWSSHASIFNSYGPSECAIISTCFAPKNVNEASKVGYPTGTRLWVTQMTDYNQLCPIGVAGELLIDGPMLARGYLNDKEKTATAFIENPSFMKDLAVQPGDRYYRTGDLVRQNQDGSLTHLGRRDTQVKIRGQRVEIGEIETIIEQNLQIAKSVMVLISYKGQKTQQTGVIAVVELRDDGLYTESTRKCESRESFLPPSDRLREVFDQLRKTLFEALPAYMVPNLFLPISRIPLNPSGKLDRRATQALIEDISPEQMQRFLTIEHKVAPTSKTEKILQLLWANVLGIDANLIGIQDHFFQIGGDSVGAIRVVAAARERSRLRVTVADILRHPQLSDLAQFLDHQDADASHVDADEADDPPFSMWKVAQGADVKTQLDRVAAECDIDADQIDDIYPCTPLQEGLIAITSRQPTAYVYRRVFSLDNTIDTDRFKAAWQTMADSAPILRTRILFGQQVESLQVVVHEKLQWHSGISLESYLEEDRSALITHGQPLNRFGLIQGSSGDRFCVWTTHHSSYDGWSMNLILQQVADIYLHGSVPRLIPYTRFIRYLETVDIEATKKYWQQQLQDAIVSELPPLPSVNYQPRPQKRIKRAIDLVAGMRTSTMMSDVLRAAWALVSAQYADQNCSTFTVALSGRNAPVIEIASLVAPTVTTVPLHVRIDRSQTVQEFFQYIEEQRIGMLPYEQTGLQRIKRLVPEVKAALELRHLFLVQPAAGADTGVQIPGLDEVPVPADEFDSYGLCVECTLGSTAVDVDVRLDENMISVARVERLLAQFAHVVRQLSDPKCLGRHISDIDLVSPQDLQVIKAWNQSVPPPILSLVHSEVEHMAKKQPDAPAICAWDGNLTYKELVTKAATLAHHLNALGVGPETSVSFCMDKSQWAVIAMLAILQSGGTVVPLGTSYPIKRVQGIINDAAARWILVDQTQADRLSELAHTLPNPHLITVDSVLMSSLPSKETNPIGKIVPSNLAWVVYTSGSTGVPKGVMLEHSALCTSLHHLGARFGMGVHTRTIQFAAHTFDAVIQDVFATLHWAGVVCIPSENDRMNDLAGVMRSMDINFANFTSTVARLLTPAEIPSLRTMVLAGEPVQEGVVETWHKHVDVLNSYGPSECSINSTCNGPLRDSSQHANIGVAMGTRLWITEANDPNKLSPIGIPGELLIEGPQLSRGYLNDVERTNESFLTDPKFMLDPALGLAPGRRLYRTGDLAKQSDDGSLTHIGRRDNQIKIRGQRVEVGEIEYWITKNLRLVRNVAVTLTNKDRGNQLGLTALIEFASESEYSRGDEDNGFLLPTDDLRDTLQRLKSSLLDVLPMYMVPSIYIPVVRMPLNLSNKLDRRAVGELVAKMSVEDLHRYTATQIPVDATTLTETERRLRLLWAQTLGIDVEVIGAHTHFFELGGDSVTAMRIVVTARENKLLRVTVADIFAYPQLSKLAAALDAQVTRDGNVAIEEEEEVAPFELLDDFLEGEQAEN
ncbi:hypothetical protein ACLMJK_009551 [Lecanora helva]